MKKRKQVTIDEQIELHFKGKKLKNLDGWFGSSDPYIQLMKLVNGDNEQNATWEKVGCTEVVKNNLSPTWKVPIVITYIFGRNQTYRMIVSDMDKKGKSEVMGQVDFTLGAILSQGGADIQLKDKKGKKAGTIRIDFEKLEKECELYHFDFKATNLKNLEWFTNSDPFLRFYRPTKQFTNVRRVSEIPEKEWKLVYESVVIKDNLNPDWPPFSISGTRLSNNDMNCPIKFEIWDYSKTMNHSRISTGYFTVGMILDGKIKEVKTYDSKKKFAGTVILEDFKREMDYTLTDYLRAGLKISTVMAIDFTGSNLEYTNPASLHYIDKDGGMFNPYQQVIRGVGNILEYYDDDNMIPVYGFGAKSKAYGMKSVSHCFPVSGNLKNAFAKRISGVLEVYEKALPNLEFRGPTYFSPIIKGIASTVKNRFKKDPMAYCILLIVTDGLISDFDETVEAIVHASEYPISILIVGVGDEDFDQMQILDGDGGVLQGESDELDENGNPKIIKAKRDIVQFVDYKQFKNRSEKLVEEVLAEIPDQVTGFYKYKGISPDEL